MEDWDEVRNLFFLSFVLGNGVGLVEIFVVTTK